MIKIMRMRIHKRNMTWSLIILSVIMFILVTITLSFSRATYDGPHINRALQAFTESDASSYNNFIWVNQAKKTSEGFLQDERSDLERVLRIKKNIRRGRQKSKTSGTDTKNMAVDDDFPDYGIRDESKKLAACPVFPSTLKGRHSQLNHHHKWPLISPDKIASLYPQLRDGGRYTPTSCRATSKTAILIPYRDRWEHLHKLLPVLIPMLMRQQIEFTVYIVELDSRLTFNKGILFNAGFLEAVNTDDYDCFVLHDVDMIPLDDRNMYKCHKSGPVHFSAGVNKFDYNSSYVGLFGGVVAFTREQFETINGASNMYFGWGAEDDDLRDRSLNKGYVLNRKPIEHGLYDMVMHNGASGWSKNPERFKVFAQRLKRQDIDGLNSVSYSVLSVGVLPIYTWIYISFDPEEIRKTVPEDMQKGENEDHDFMAAPVHSLKSKLYSII